MRLAILLSMCPTDLEKELTAQQHVFLDDPQMKVHVATVINSHPRGLAPMMMGNLSDEDSNHHASSDESVESDNGELYRLEIRNGKKVFTKSRHEPSKRNGGGKGKIDRMFPLWTHWSHSSSQKSHQWGPPRSAPKGKSVGNCEDEETETSQNVPLGTMDLGSFEVLSDHGDEVKVDEPTMKPQK